MSHLNEDIQKETLRRLGVMANEKQREFEREENAELFIIAVHENCDCSVEEIRDVMSSVERELATRSTRIRLCVIAGIALVAIGAIAAILSGRGTPAPPVSDWVTILRSDDPQLWNTSQDSPSGFAISHGDPRMPAEVSYVRLARRDTGDAVIIPMTRENLSKKVPVAGGYIWNGTAEQISRNLKGKPYESRLLGIGSEGMLRRYKDQGGIVTVSFDRQGEKPSGHAGWGFGRTTNVYSSQTYVWDGNLISGKTAFEIAVKSGRLTAEEQAFLLK